VYLAKASKKLKLIKNKLQKPAKLAGFFMFRMNGMSRCQDGTGRTY